MQSIMLTLLSLRAHLEDRKRQERGATGVEYGLLVALIAAIIVGTVALLGQEILAAFEEVLDEL